MRGPGDARLERWLQATVVVLVLIQVLFWRNMMDADGMSYLDVAHAYAEGDWAGAVNAYWSPLYSWLLTALIVIFHLSPRQEIAVTNALSFVLFLLALAAFSFFLHQLLARTSVAEERTERASNRAWLALAYAALAYACISLTHVGRGGPDLLLAASFYMAMGLMLRFARASTREIPTGLLLGAVLGLGYLAKAVMFPVAVLALVCFGVLTRRAKRGTLGLALAILAFGGISAPWIATLSHAKGRWTYGDTGRLNYFWYVNDGAQGDPAYGRILHPPRELSRSPVVYEFAEPVRGTYPLWYDPSYGTRVCARDLISALKFAVCR